MMRASGRTRASLLMSYRKVATTNRVPASAANELPEGGYAERSKGSGQSYRKVADLTRIAV